MLNPVRRYRFTSRWISMAVRVLDAAGYQFARQKIFEPEHIKKILVIRLDDIGDLILATPVVRNLRESFASATIDILVKPSTKDIVINNPCVNKIWTIEPFWMRSAKPFGLIQWLRFIRQLRKEKYDLAVELRGNPFNILLAFATGGTQRVGYGTQGLGFLLTSVIPYDNNIKHEIDRNLDVLRGLGLPVYAKNPEFFIPETAEHFAGRFLEARDMGKDDLLICMHPGAPWLPKRWPQERFAELANALIDGHKAKVVLLGSPDEFGLCANIRDLMPPANRPRVVIAAGTTNIHQTAALIKKCKVFVGNDSGPMHIAQAVNTDSVALFGPQTPDVFGPCGNRAEAIYRKPDCSPCIQRTNRGCSRGFSCCEGLLNITFEDVLNVIGHSIAKHRVNL